MRRFTTTSVASIILAGWAGTANADGPYVHARASAGHALTEPQSSELGWGGGGSLVLDVPVAKFLGLEVGGTALALSQGAPPENPAFAQRQAGTTFGATAGVRVSLGDVWIDGGAGVAATGTGAQPMVMANIGFDLHVRGPWYVGPYIGYTQIADLGDTLRPGDARVLQFGVQISLGKQSAKPPPPILAKAVPPPHVEPAKLPADRDADEIVDTEDACPDVVGIPTPQEPSTNGCPPTAIKLAGDRIQLPDRVYFDFDSPNVKDRSLPMLKQIAEYLEARGDIQQIEVDGFADEIGSDEYNLELSRLRAENVKAWLIRYGVSARCVTQAFGETNPRVHGHTVEQLRENRRVELYVQRIGDAAFHQEETHASNRELVGLSAVLLVACADVNSVVGGACAQGYVEQGNTCVPATSLTTPNGSDGGLPQSDAQSDAAPSTSGDSGSGGSDAGAGSNPTSTWNGASGTCIAPEIQCGTVCVDPTSDPDNCGSCGHVCPSNSCVASKCVGSAPGHVVVIGHDYTTSPSTSSSQARVLSNATLMPASNPLRVMSYEQYASPTAVINAETLVDAEAKLLGRTVTFVPFNSSTTVSGSIDITTYDVLVVHDQIDAPSGTLASIGTTWQSDGNVAAFLHAGGVVVVLTGGSGTAEMPALASNADLLSIQSQTVITGSLTVLAPADAVGSGVISPYIPKPSTVSLTTEADGGDVVWVVGQSGAPVVVHKVMP